MKNQQNIFHTFRSISLLLVSKGRLITPNIIFILWMKILHINKYVISFWILGKREGVKRTNEILWYPSSIRLFWYHIKKTKKACNIIRKQIVHSTLYCWRCFQCFLHVLCTLQNFSSACVCKFEIFVVQNLVKIADLLLFILSVKIISISNIWTIEMWEFF